MLFRSRYLDYVATLDGVPDDQAKTARELDEYVRTRRDLSDAASKVLSPRIKLDDRPARPPVTPAERAEIAKAIEDLEEHMRLAPDRWEAAWLHAKSLPLLGKRDEAFAAWQRAFERFPAARDLARDYAGELLHAGLATQGRDVARAIVDRLPDDATLWCNLAVAELLAGDLDAAEAALAHSRARDLDAADPITKVMIKRCAAYRDGAPLPKTLAELSRGP